MTLPVTDPRARFENKKVVVACLPPPFFIQSVRILFCYDCDEQTEFRLNEERTAYHCTVCGLEIDYHIAM